MERALEVAIMGWGAGQGMNAAEEAIKRKRLRAAITHARGSEIGKFSRGGVGGGAAAASVEVLALRVRQKHMKGARREQIYGGGINEFVVTVLLSGSRPKPRAFAGQLRVSRDCRVVPACNTILARGSSRPGSAV